LREGSSVFPISVEMTADPDSPPELKTNAVEESASGGSHFRAAIGGVLILAIIAVCAGAVLLFGTKRNLQSRPKVPPTDRIRSESPPGLRLNGTTEAVESRSILAPLLAGQQLGTLTIIMLAPGGSRVKRGALLVEFDRQSQIHDFIDKQAEYGKLVDQVVEERAKEDAARAKDETEVKQAEDNLSKSELEMQKVEILSRIDAEKARQNLEEATATLHQLVETFDLKREAAKAAIRILEIQRDRTREIMLHAQANSELMQIHSPIDGVVVLNTIWKQGKMGEVQDGDQIRAGVPFLQVVDPSRMQVRVPVNQQDFLSLQIGQSARVHLDAYPQLELPGKLEEMAPIGRNGDFSSKLRTFTVVFSIAGDDARLMPDLSAAVDVDIARHAHAGGGAQ
jgi:HlyD family secretion protein